MSFLQKEEEPQSAFWDWAIGISLILVIGGFTAYYQYQKRYSIKGFQEADSLFRAGAYHKAEGMYEQLKSAQYLTTQHDSVIYARLDTIESVRERQAALISQSQ